MTELIENVGKLFAILIGFFGVSKIVNAPLSKRVAALEQSPPKRDVAECNRLMANCPVAIKLMGLEENNKGLTAWLIRIETKLDRVIEDKQR
jgi:hypothetical protein